MNETLTLYSNPMSRGRIARWMLEEVGEPYEYVSLDYGSSMKAADFLAINPMGKVPAVTHGSRVITEAAAICAYLADAFPARKLAPAPADRADYYRWLFFMSGPFEAAITNKSLGFEHPAEKNSMVGFGHIDTVIDVLEKTCTARHFIAGDTFSAADVYVGAQIGYSLMFGTLDKRPAFESYFARVSDREAYRRADKLDQVKPALYITVDDLSDKRVIALLEEHLTDMRSLSPACSAHAFDIAQLKSLKVTIYTAWNDDELLGCGALHELDATHAELKSMRTVSSALRTGVSSKILAHLMAESRKRGYQRLSLETGSQPGFLPARMFYEHHGFTATEPFAEYTNDPNSVYYSIQLDTCPAAEQPL